MKTLKEFWIGPAFSDIYKDWETPFLRMEKLPLIIGLAGPTKTGKTIMARHLATGYGFQYISLSTYLDKIAKSLGIVDGDWRKIRGIAINLRKEFGNEIVAQLALQEIVKKYQKGDKFVIDSIYHPAEVEFFRALKNFALIWLDVDQSLRIQVAKNWYKGIGDPSADLKMRDKLEQLEENSNIGPEPNLYLCYKLRDEILSIRKEEGFNAHTVFFRFDNLIQKLT